MVTPLSSFNSLAQTIWQRDFSGISNAQGFASAIFSLANGVGGGNSTTITLNELASAAKNATGILSQDLPNLMSTLSALGSSQINDSVTVMSGVFIPSNPSGSPIAFNGQIEFWDTPSGAIVVGLNSSAWQLQYGPSGQVTLTNPSTSASIEIVNSSGGLPQLIFNGGFSGTQVAITSGPNGSYVINGNGSGIPVNFNGTYTLSGPQNAIHSATTPTSATNVLGKPETISLTATPSGVSGQGWVRDGSSLNIYEYNNAFSISHTSINEFQETSGPIFTMQGAPSGVFVTINQRPNGQFTFTFVSGSHPSGPDVLTPSANAVSFSWDISGASKTSATGAKAAFSGAPFKVADSSGILSVDQKSLPSGWTIESGNSTHNLVLSNGKGGGTISFIASSGPSGVTVSDKGVSGAITFGASGNNIIVTGGGSGSFTLTNNGTLTLQNLPGDNASATKANSKPQTLSLTATPSGSSGPGWVLTSKNPNIFSHTNAFGISGLALYEFQKPSGPVFNMQLTEPSGIYVSIDRGPKGAFTFTYVPGSHPSGPNVLTPSMNPVAFSWDISGASKTSATGDKAAFSGAPFKVADSSGILSVDQKSLPSGWTIESGNSTHDLILSNGKEGTISFTTSSSTSGVLVTDKNVSGAISFGPSGNDIIVTGGGSGPDTLIDGGTLPLINLPGDKSSATKDVTLGTMTVTLTPSGISGTPWSIVPNSNNTTYNDSNAFGITGMTLGMSELKGGPDPSLTGGPSALYVIYTTGPNEKFTFTLVSGSKPTGTNVLSSPQGTI